jgi:hypothetical protein
MLRNRIFQLFKSPQATETSPPLPQTFTTQDEIIANVQAPASEEGICLPLSNLYTKYQLGTGTRDFMQGTPHEIYNRAVQEREHQKALVENNPSEDSVSAFSDGMHSAFVDSHVPYHLSVVDANTLKTPSGLSKVVGDSSNVLITYPVKKTTQQEEMTFFHQVAVGRDKHTVGNCYSFSANLSRGERIHPCQDGFPDIRDEIERSIDPMADTVFVARERHHH